VDKNIERMNYIAGGIPVPPRWMAKVFLKLLYYRLFGSQKTFGDVMLLLLRQRNQIFLPLTGQLIIVLPEEYIADLEAFYQQMKSEERSIWFIRKKMLWTILELLWALHIQINVENLWLPQNKGRNKIDD
jgi:hypothetical protein